MYESMTKISLKKYLVISPFYCDFAQEAYW